MLAAHETHKKYKNKGGQGTLSQLRASTSGETLKCHGAVFPATQFAQTLSVSIKNLENLLLQNGLEESHQVAVQHITFHFVYWTFKKIVKKIR